MTPAETVNDFSGRVAIVTGAGRGLGRATAERLYERGASVAVNVRDPERAEELAASLGDRALAIPGDVSANGVPAEIVRRTIERFGRVDILVNNAAFARSTRFSDLSADEWREALEQLAANPSQRAAMGELGQRTVRERYATPVVGRQYLDLLGEVLARVQLKGAAASC